MDTISAKQCLNEIKGLISQYYNLIDSTACKIPKDVNLHLNSLITAIGTPDSTMTNYINNIRDAGNVMLLGDGSSEGFRENLQDVSEYILNKVEEIESIIDEPNSSELCIQKMNQLMNYFNEKSLDMSTNTEEYYITINDNINELKRII